MAERSFIEENKAMLLFVSGAVLLGGISYILLSRRNEPTDSADTSQASGAVLAQIKVVGGNTIYAYRVAIALNQEEVSRLLEQSDALGSLNKLYLIGTTVKPAPMLGLAADVNSLGNSTEYKALGLLSPSVSYEDLILTRTKNVESILRLFNIDRADGEAYAQGLAKLKEIIFTGTIKARLSSLLALVCSMANSYWLLRRSSASAAEQPSCKAGISPLEAQRISAAVIWTVLQDAVIRQGWTRASSEEGLQLAINQMLADLKGPLHQLEVNNSHEWFVELFAQGCFNCETPSRNRIMLVDSTYLKQSDGRQRPTPIDTNAAAGLSNIIGGAVFYTKES